MRAADVIDTVAPGIHAALTDPLPPANEHSAAYGSPSRAQLTTSCCIAQSAAAARVETPILP